MIVLNKNKQIFKGRYGHSATCVDGQNIFIFGGSEEKQKNDVLRFDLLSGNFHKVKVYQEDDTAPSPRDFHASVMDDEKIYVIGVSYEYLNISLLQGTD